MKKVYTYIVEPIVKHHPYLIGKFEPEPNLTLAEPEPEPCDLASCQRQTNTISKTKIVLDLNATRKKMFAKEIKRRDESNAKQNR